jgi:hypothetical protein
MSPKHIPRRIVAIIAAVVVMLNIAVILVSLSPKPSPAVNGGQLAKALAQYVRDRHSHGDPVPKSVKLETLRRLGYLEANDVTCFEGADVIFYADADDSNPQSPLVEARMPDGQVLAVLADGSVQQFSRSKWAEYRRNLADTNSPPEASQPVAH